MSTKKARAWVEKRYGARPTALPHAQAISKARTLRGLAKRAEKKCIDDLIWDARLDAVSRMFAELEKAANERKKLDDL